MIVAAAEPSSSGAALVFFQLLKLKRLGATRLRLRVLLILLCTAKAQYSAEHNSSIMSALSESLSSAGTGMCSTATMERVPIASVAADTTPERIFMRRRSELCAKIFGVPDLFPLPAKTLGGRVQSRAESAHPRASMRTSPRLIAPADASLSLSVCACVCVCVCVLPHDDLFRYPLARSTSILVVQRVAPLHRRRARRGPLDRATDQIAALPAHPLRRLVVRAGRLGRDLELRGALGRRED